MLCKRATPKKRYSICFLVNSAKFFRKILSEDLQEAASIPLTFQLFCNFAVVDANLVDIISHSHSHSEPNLYSHSNFIVRSVSAFISVIAFVSRNVLAGKQILFFLIFGFGFILPNLQSQRNLHADFYLTMKS